MLSHAHVLIADKADRDTPSAASAMTCLEVLADLSRQPSPMQKVFQDLHQEFQVRSESLIAMQDRVPA